MTTVEDRPLDAPILDLDAIENRDTINIRSQLHKGGKLYELRNVEELSVEEYQRIIAIHNKVVRIDLRDTEKLKPREAQLIDELLNEAVELMAIGIEAEVLEALTAMKKAMIIAAWSERVTVPAGAEGEGLRRSTGESSSRGSKTTTAATKGDG